jgi:hypothetical protein
MWTYRDWVIGAFNRNLPFDRFTVEQLAGDLLPDRSLEQQVASGFNRCNMTTNEGGTIPEENLVNYTRDPAGLVSQVWILTPEEANTQRASAEQPGFFNFWPFASSSGQSRIDPLTPYDQLPRYGE